MNVHVFDGHLANSKACIQETLDRVSAISREEKISAFRKLQEIIHHPNLDILANNYIVNGRNSGYDPINDLYTDDLLYICYELLSDDLIRILLEQLDDLYTGLCPQGRIHRLFQVIIAFKNNPTSNF